MKKILSGLVLASLLVVPAIGLAQPADNPAGPPPASGDDPNLKEVPPDLDIMDLLQTLANWLLTILLIVAAIFIIIAGFYFVTAMGDPAKVATARQFVLYALIGVAVGLASKGLVLLIESIVE
ncbi:MAG: hypothetical protein U9Q16_01655 [Patescibacteria group bacterium]|nr:hypothetical protein [Patescibacteria group bacterium]